MTGAPRRPRPAGRTTPEAAVADADIVASATDSMEPTFDRRVARARHARHQSRTRRGERGGARALRRQDPTGGSRYPHARERTRMQPGIGHSPMAVLAGDRGGTGAPAAEARARHLPGGLPDLLRPRDRQGSGAHGGGPDHVLPEHRVSRASSSPRSAGWSTGGRGKAGLGREIPTEWFLQDIRD